jgi:pimeloyl-ACP methyl ester carboxylesterase
MPLLTTDDGVKLHCEEVGSGAPLIFVHEFAGDWRSWEPQLRHFGRRYRCIAYNARGFTPSDVPDDVEKDSQDRACDDIKAVMDALKLDKAHIVGLSMGGFATLHFGFTYPERVLSLVIGGCGYGASADKRAQFAEETEAAARRFEEVGMSKAQRVTLAPSRAASRMGRVAGGVRRPVRGNDGGAADHAWGAEATAVTVRPGQRAKIIPRRRSS